MAVAKPTRPLQLRQAEMHERFVAFAFAGSDMMIEIDDAGGISYAAGTFRSTFGQPAEAYVGQPVRGLVASGDQEALDSALMLLAQRGRLSPVMIRLADPKRTCFAISGLALPAPGRPTRFCLCFAIPPAPASRMMRMGTVQGMARATEARLRAGEVCNVGLFELEPRHDAAMDARDAIGQALESAAPDAMVAELAPGRFGVLGLNGLEEEIATVARLLEGMLTTQGVQGKVAAKHLPITADGLTPAQATRALRQALDVFAREGVSGFTRAGFGGGLANYIRLAGARSATLRQAIEAGHFSLVFQPIVSLSDGSVHHYEALIRPKPIGGCTITGPQDFVMQIESLGLAEDLDLAVARMACAAATGAEASVAFNVSGQSAQSAAFRERLVALLAVDPARTAGRVIVEMTETAQIEDVPEAAQTARALQDMGVPFCLDDFGAGAADVRLLRALGADIVKLDGSYLAGVTEGGRERAFIAGMVEIARAAGASVVAERVETETEAGLLRAMGVDYAQGWLFGRPDALPGPRVVKLPVAQFVAGGWR